MCCFEGRSIMHEEPVCFLWFIFFLSKHFKHICVLIQGLTTLLHYIWVACYKTLILFLCNQWKHYFGLHCFVKLLYVRYKICTLVWKNQCLQELHNNTRFIVFLVHRYLLEVFVFKCSCWAVMFCCSNYKSNKCIVPIY